MLPYSNGFTALTAAFLLYATATFGDVPQDPVEAEPPCARSMCGCSRAHSIDATFRLTDANDEPITDAHLICHDSGNRLGTGGSDSDGILKLSVAGRLSPGCGFQSDCRIAYISSEDNRYGRLIWFLRLVRGIDVSTDTVELVDENESRPD